MSPSEASTPDELYLALLESKDEAPLVRLDTLVETLGLETARKLVPIQTHNFINRDRAIEMIALKKAVDMLTPLQQQSLLPKGTENLGNNSSSEKV